MTRKQATGSPKQSTLSRTLTPKEAFALRERFGIKAPPGFVVETAQTESSACSVCGRKSKNILRIFNGKQFITICQDCLNMESSND